MATRREARSSSSGGPAAAPWARADSIGYPAWQRLVHPGISAGETALASAGHQTTAVYERYMGFVDSLAVRPGGGDGGFGGQGDDLRVFRRAPPAVASSRYVPALRPAPRAVVVSGSPVFRSAGHCGDSPGDTASGAAPMHGPGTNTGPIAVADEGSAAMGAATAAGVRPDDVYTAAPNTAPVAMRMVAAADRPVQRQGAESAAGADATVGVVNARGAGIDAGAGRLAHAVLPVETTRTVDHVVAPGSASAAAGATPIAIVTPVSLSRAIDGSIDATLVPSAAAAASSGSASASEPGKVNTAASPSAMVPSVASAGRPAPLIHRSASARKAADARDSSPTSVDHAAAWNSPAVRAGLPSSPSPEAADAIGAQRSALAASSTASSASASASASVPASGHSPALGPAVGSAPGELARGMAAVATASTTPAPDAPAVEPAPRSALAPAILERAASALASRAFDGDGAAQPLALPAVVAEAAPRPEVSMPLASRGHALRLPQDNAEPAPERPAGTIESPRSAEPLAARSAMPEIATTIAAGTGSQAATTVLQPAFDAHANVAVGASTGDGFGIGADTAAGTNLGTSTGTGTSTTPGTSLPPMSEGAPSAHAPPTFVAPVVLSARAASPAMSADAPDVGLTMTSSVTLAPEMVLRRNGSAAGGEGPPHGTLRGDPSASNAAGLAAEQARHIDSTGAPPRASADAPAPSVATVALAATSAPLLHRRAEQPGTVPPHADSTNAVMQPRSRSDARPFGQATGAPTPDARPATLARSHTTTGPQPHFGTYDALAIGASPMAGVPEPSRPDGLIFAGAPRGSVIGRRTMLAQAVDRAYRLPNIAAPARGPLAVDTVSASAGQAPASVPAVDRLPRADSPGIASNSADSHESETPPAAHLARQFDEAPALAHPLLAREAMEMPLAHLRAPRASAVGASTGPITTTPSVDPPTFAVPSADSVAPAAATAASKSLIVVANAMPAGASSGLPVMRAPAPLRARHFIPREPSAASIDTAAGAPIPAAGVASAAQPGFVFSPSVSATWPAPALLHRALAALSPHGEVEADRSAAHSQPRMTFTAGGADVHRAIERNAVEWPLVTAMRSPAGPDAFVPAEGRSSTSTYTPASPPLRAAHPGPVAMTLARRLSADTAAPTIDRALTAAAAPAAHTTSPLAELPMPAPAPTVHHTEGAHAHAHAGASRGEVDVDDIVERVWREVLSRLAVDLERRGFARWA